MTMRLYNTATRTKEDFQPLDPANVRMYVCGPTVYDYVHIGNARPVIVFDLLFRLLQQVYGQAHVTYARNITDVDDKIINRAERDGVDIGTLTATTAAQFQQDMLALGCLNPTVEPRATEHITQMVDMIKRLIEGGHAYPDGHGHVLFSVNSWDRYGRLANRSTKEMVAGARVEIATNKRDPMDFVLWKPSYDDQPGWVSPWGMGRPGWHIECSAMSKEHLGDVFDIHGGGLDLIFPHHQNEVAQSCCDHGGAMFGDRQDFAKVWMHNGYLQVEGRKMSKSEGNFLVVHDLLEQWPREVLRLQMLMTHYRQPLDWTADKTEECVRIIDRWKRIETPADNSVKLPAEFIEILCDDLNTPLAISFMHELVVSANKGNTASLGAFMACRQLLGISFTHQASGSITVGVSVSANPTVISGANIIEKIDQRANARKNKNWKEADKIRNQLLQIGITLEDSKDPNTGEIVTTWEVKR